MISKTELLKITARSAYYVASRAAGFAALGFVLNLILLPFLWPEISRFAHVFVVNLPHAGGAAAFFMLAIMLIYMLPGILLGAAFVVGFPVAYFLFGKKHGISVAMMRLLRDKKEALLLYFFDRLFSAVRGRADWAQRFQQSGIGAIVSEVLPRFAASLPGMPLPMRWLLRRALARVKLESLAEVLTAGGDLRELDLSALSEPVLARVSALIDDRLLTPSLKGLGVLMAVNLGAFALVKILF